MRLVIKRKSMYTKGAFKSHSPTICLMLGNDGVQLHRVTSRCPIQTLQVSDGERKILMQYPLNCHIILFNVAATIPREHWAGCSLSNTMQTWFHYALLCNYTPLLQAGEYLGSELSLYTG